MKIGKKFKEHRRGNQQIANPEKLATFGTQDIGRRQKNKTNKQTKYSTMAK